MPRSKVPFGSNYLRGVGHLRRVGFRSRRTQPRSIHHPSCTRVRLGLRCIRIRQSPCDFDEDGLVWEEKKVGLYEK